jgi:hypothetical protein
VLAGTSVVLWSTKGEKRGKPKPEGGILTNTPAALDEYDQGWKLQPYRLRIIIDLQCHGSSTIHNVPSTVDTIRTFV